MIATIRLPIFGNNKETMRRTHIFASLLLLGGGVCAGELDHREFEATLHVPYAAQGVVAGMDKAARDGARTFTLDFSYPHVDQPHDVSWRLELVAPDGKVVRHWDGVRRLFRKAVAVTVRWPGRSAADRLPDGVYQVRMRAAAHPATRGNGDASAAAIEDALARAGDETIEQRWDLALGTPPATPMPVFRALPSPGMAQAGGDAAIATAAPAPAALPYTVYYGNLHSQTNHSDGGGALSSCGGAQAPQSGAQGPAEAFAYARNRGLDFLVASEHNHMYDGSDSTNTSANPATARALYQSGLAAAADFNGKYPGFLGVYGLEWGVINNGGHLNIFNSPELLQWEVNSGGQLLGDTLTPKNDYAALYTLMRQRGWIGQFNHPSSSGQFLVNGVPLGYTADGDQAMALCEVLNTSAFSTNTTETETGRSSYEGACNKALEAGFHVAFSTNQDNHCANWGASYTNRTGVLIPNGTALTQASFIDALRARRVFATMDKNAQLVLTANGHVMGERFTNSGPLTLAVEFANSTGKTVSTVSLVEGVPGRNGTVSVLSTSANTTVTPAPGEHFYYAKVTQSDGNILWSAPVWVTQTAGGDTSAPTVSAAASGSSGTIAFTANATDNVGVNRVDFYVDDVLKGTDSSSPYTVSVNSTGLSNGSHSLTATATDAAGNLGRSTPVVFSVNNTGTPPAGAQLVQNGGFEAGATAWSASSGVITNNATYPAHGGTWMARLNGQGAARTDTLYQQLTIPSTVSKASLSFWLRIASSETTTTNAYDTLKVQVRSSTGTLLATLATYSNLNKGSSYVQRSFDLSAYKGQTVRVHFEGKEGTTLATAFVVDDVLLTTQ